jgi:hypothetical protein
MIDTQSIDQLRNQLSVKAKNGLDFILSACIIWSLIAYIWTLGYSSYDKSILTFIAGGFMLPLALLFSRILKTNWKLKNNPLQPLGLWLNFAQLLYFPFLILVLAKFPDYFVLTYVIITGGHFFPYAWFYRTNLYAVFAGLISFGSLIIGLNVSYENTFLIAVFMSAMLIILAFLLYLDFKKKSAVASF